MSRSKPYPQGTIVEVKKVRVQASDINTSTFTALIVSQTKYYRCLSEYLVLRIASVEPRHELEYSLPARENLLSTSTVTTIFETVKGFRVQQPLARLRRSEIKQLRERLHSILAVSPDYLTNYPEPIGQVVLGDFPFSDREGYKERPAVIVNTPLHYNFTQRLIVLYCTTNLKATCPTDYSLVYPEQAGLKRDTVVRCRVFSLPKQKVKQVIGRLAIDDFAEIQVSLRRAFGLGED